MTDETKTSLEPGGATSPLKPAEASEAGARSIGPGDALGRFTVRARIGAGGMGEVYSAYDPELERTVAIKVIRGEHGGESPEARARFQREAQAMARLNHPNVIGVYEVGTVGDRVFVVMELVDGPTLDAWLARSPRRAREIVAVFLQAGEGLAAAHAAGIIHRDFKPSNVIVGPRVRVADFGLARAVKEAAAERTSSASLLDQEVTRTGHAPGTPAYMAPELRSGGGATFLSDQYAFGLCLRQALAKARHGPRLRAVHERATRPDPAARYPSMRALLAELGRDPARRTVLWLAVTAVAASVLAVALSSFRSRTDPCAGGEAVMAGVWNEPARQKVAAAFRATGRPYAETTFASVDRALGERAARWTAARRDACEATHVRHEQSDSLFDLRMQCLSRARADVTALVDLFTHADPTTLDRATSAAGAVGDTAECADANALAALQAAPHDPAVAAEVAAIGNELARMTALELAGKWPQALALAEADVPRARKIDWNPALAETLVRAGRMALVLRKDVDLAMARLHEAARVAAAARADLTVARADSALLYGYGTIKRHAQSAAVAYEEALVAAARVGNPSEILAQILQDEAAALYAAGNYLAAIGIDHVKLGLRGWLDDFDGWRYGLALVDFAGAAAKLGYGREVTPMYDRALAFAERDLGLDHPQVTVLRHSAASTRILDGDLEGGAALLARSLASVERVFGAEGLYAAKSTMALADVRFEERRMAEAAALTRRARAIYARELGSASPQAIECDGFLVEILRLGGQPRAALALARQAMATVRGAPELPAGYEANFVEEEASALLALGKVAEAREGAERALALQLKDPSDNLKMADAYLTAGDAESAAGHAGDAVNKLRRSLELRERQVGPDNTTLVEPLAHLCDALLAGGDRAGAAEVARRALALPAGGFPDERARARFCLARVEASGGDAVAAAREGRAARAELAALGYPAPLLGTVVAWLAKR